MDINDDLEFFNTLQKENEAREKNNRRLRRTEMDDAKREAAEAVKSLDGSDDDAAFEAVTVRLSPVAMNTVRDIAEYEKRPVSTVLRWCVDGTLSEYAHSVRFADPSEGDRVESLLIDLIDRMSAVELEVRHQETEVFDLIDNYNKMASSFGGDDSRLERYMLKVEDYEKKLSEEKEKYLEIMKEAGEAICSFLL